MPAKKRKRQPIITGLYFSEDAEQAIVRTAELYDTSRSKVVRTLVEGWCSDIDDPNSMAQDIARAFGDIRSKQLSSRSEKISEIAEGLGAGGKRS